MTWIPGQDEAVTRCRDGTHWYPSEPETANCQCGQTTREARGDRYVITARFSELGQDEAVRDRQEAEAAAWRAFCAGYQCGFEDGRADDTYATQAELRAAYEASDRA